MSLERIHALLAEAGALASQLSGHTAHDRGRIEHGIAAAVAAASSSPLADVPVEPVSSEVRVVETVPDVAVQTVADPVEPSPAVLEHGNPADPGLPGVEHLELHAETGEHAEPVVEHEPASEPVEVSAAEASDNTPAIADEGHVASEPVDEGHTADEAARADQVDIHAEHVDVHDDGEKA